MSENPDKKNDVIFLGINFHNFFQNCCVARKVKEKVLSSDGEDRQEQLFKFVSSKKNPQDLNGVNVGLNEDGHSAASSTDWTDLEDFIVPNPVQVEGTAMEEENLFATGTPADDFLTQEPIDFECIIGF